jgi:general secretion pathway protein I
MTVLPHLPRHATRRPGITLIEVLLGLAIFLLALVAISRLIDVGTQNALESNFQADGTRLAQAKLAEVEAGAIAVSGGGSGSFDEEPAWNWTVESTPGNVPNLYTVKVTVSRVHQGRTTSVAISQMIFDPLQMGAAAEIAKPTTTATPTTGTAP